MKRNSEAAPALLGIDCGGTHSTALYRHGETSHRASAGPGNVRLLSDAELLDLFGTLASVHDKLHSPAAVAIGMAGAGTDAQRRRIQRAAAKVWPRSQLTIVGDLDTALAAAELDGPAGTGGVEAVVVALSGTGSVFYGRNARDQRVRVGGWGHIVGDKGSAYEIGLRALKATLYYADREGTVPPLGRSLLAALLLNELSEIPEWVLTAPKTEVGQLAPVVFAAAQKGDTVARDILEGAAASLARDTVTCAQRLAKNNARVRFVLGGSVLLKQPAFARDVRRRITESWRNSLVTTATREPAEGALALARQSLSLPTDTSATAAAATKPHWTSQLSIADSPTEQRNPRSVNLHKLALDDAIELMLSEDEKIPAALRDERRKISRVIRLVVTSFKTGGRLFYVGAGTSGRLGVLDASECPPTFRTDPELVQGIIAGGQTALWRAAEGAEDNPEAGARAVMARGVNKRDVVIGIAASGRTPFVWGALDAAKSRGAATVLLTLNPNLRVPPEHRPTVTIAPAIGPEILTGSTRLKSGTATKLILNMITTLAMVRTGKVLSNLMVDVKATNVKLRDRAIRITMTLAECSREEAEAALDATNWVITAAVTRLPKSRQKRTKALPSRASAQSSRTKK